jgi:hypothetical protein
MDVSVSARPSNFTLRRTGRSRCSRLGVEVTTLDHRWCRWRSVYVHDPEGNILELVCYDEAIE